MFRAKFKEFLVDRGVYWIVSLAVATIIARIGFGVVRDVSLQRFVAEHPHDGQNGLGAVACGMFGFAVIWPLTLWGCIAGFRLLERRDQVRQDQHEISTNDGIEVE
jgi:hypothetical protein